MPSLPLGSRLRRFALAGAGLLTLLFGFYAAPSRSANDKSVVGDKAPAYDRSPVDLILSPDGSWMATVNQTSHSVSLVEVGSGKILSEAPCGKRPSAIA